MWRRLWLLFAQTVTVAVAALFVVLTLKPQWLGGGSGGAPAMVALPAPDVTIQQVAPASAPSAAGSAAAPVPVVHTTSLAAAAQRAAPAVVSITATKSRRNPHADDPRFEFFFGRQPANQTQVGLGSGVIVSPEGYLLTNHHVVEDATGIEVMLVDGRSTRAALVGSDPETDIAVLRIELPRLPVVTLGDARTLQVGDAVLAIGNPFNVGQTVTSGIVSALGRNQAGSSPFQNFIQTDAAINPGNSGGALVDAQGRLVGINTAIFSRSGGSMGIGFAVPADTAVAVLRALLKDGVVRRGWIGVEPRDLTPELADSLNLAARSGVLITGVLQDGPAARGGLRPGDVVTQLAGQPVRNTSELLAAVAAQPPGSEATVAVQRNNQPLTLTLAVAQRPLPRRAQ